MGGSSVGCNALIPSLFSRPLDGKIITAGFGITHVDVCYIAILEESLELGLDATI
jgi:hypothetical protein